MAYSRPSPGHYPWQWYWDSCFHAIVWRRFDARRARARAAQRCSGGRAEDGFIGHTIFWHRPVDWQRRWTYNVASRDAPNTVDDPAAAARLGLADRGRRPGRRAADRGPPPVAGGAIATSTATGCSGSSSPTSRGSTRRPSSTRSGAGAPMPGLGFPFLIAGTGDSAGTRATCCDAGGPLLCEVVVNVLWCLARIAAGEPSITPAIVERLWDERRGPLPRRGAASWPTGRTDRLGRTAASVPRPGRHWRRWRFPTSRSRSAAA